MSREIPTLEDIRQAADRIAGTVRRTPLHPWGEGGVHLKLESLQPTGAFKVRGATNHLRALPAGTAGVVTASSGNHGQAVAYVASRLGIPAVVVVPETVPPNKAAGIVGYGAALVLCGKTMGERYVLARKIAAERGLHMVPSFDDPLVVSGQGTCGLEVIEQIPEVAVVAVPVSGGGLLSGVATAVKLLRPKARVVGVEPMNVARFSASREAGRRVAVRSVDTVADGLRAEETGELTWEIASRYVDDFVKVDDDAILAAVRRLCLEGHLVVEPSGAIALAAIESGLIKERPAVAIISGGNIDPALLSRLLSEGAG